MRWRLSSRRAWSNGIALASVYIWRWKSKPRGGRPAVPVEIRKLIRKMSIANPLWRAPRTHGELLELGIDIGQTSVARYMVRRRDPPSQGWSAFLRTLRDRCDGYVRRADNLVSPALWIADHGAWPATYSVVWCHSASNLRMDRKSGHGSMRGGNRLPAISFVTGAGPMVRSSLADSDR